MSLDLSRPPAEHLTLARELKALREKGVLIIGSGNLVHNLMAIAPDAPPYDWALEFDAKIAKAIDERDFARVAEAGAGGRIARLSHPTPEHFLPVLYTLGVADEQDEVSFFNASFDMASLSMRSFVLS